MKERTSTAATETSRQAVGPERAHYLAEAARHDDLTGEFKAQRTKLETDLRQSLEEKSALEKIGIIHRGLVTNQDSKLPAPTTGTTLNTYYDDPANARQEAYLNVFYSTLQETDADVVAALLAHTYRQYVDEQLHKHHTIKDIAAQESPLSADWGDMTGQEVVALEATLLRFASSGHPASSTFTQGYAEGIEATVVSEFTGEDPHIERFGFAPGESIDVARFESLLQPEHQ